MNIRPSENPDHDYDHPDDQRMFLRALDDMGDYTRNPRCPHCDEKRLPLPMPGPAWGWESFHDPGCPVNVDNQQVEPVHVTDTFDGAIYSEAEAIWAASSPDDQG